MSRRLFALLVVCLITSCIFAYRGHQGTQPESSRQGTQPESSRQGLAKRVSDRYVQALGGQGAYAKISTELVRFFVESCDSPGPSVYAA